MRSMRTSTTCAPSSAQQVGSSRRSVASAIGWRMPDGVASPTPGSPEPEVTPVEARLLRRVRLNLSLWSGAITLAVLVVLGAILYVAVDRSLADSGTRE